MLEVIEAFTKANEHTINAIGAFSTLAAVIVSLWLASRTSRTRLKAYANIMFIAHSTIDPENRPRFLTVGITNLGTMPVRVPFAFFNWKPPLKRNDYRMINPMDGYGGNEWIAQKHYPQEIPPKASQTFFVSDFEMFELTTREQFGKASALDRLRLRFMKAVVYTEDGAIFNVKLSKEVREVWSRAYREGKASAKVGNIQA